MPVGGIIIAIMPIISMLLMVGLMTSIITIFTTDIDHHIVDIPTYERYGPDGVKLEAAECRPDYNHDGILGSGDGDRLRDECFESVWDYVNIMAEPGTVGIKGVGGVADNRIRGDELTGALFQVRVPGISEYGGSAADALEGLRKAEPDYTGKSVDLSSHHNIENVYNALACAISNAESERSRLVERGNMDEAERFMKLLHTDAMRLALNVLSKNTFSVDGDGQCTTLITFAPGDLPAVDQNILIYDKNTIGLYQMMSIAQSGFDGAGSPLMRLYDFFAQMALTALLLIAIAAIVAYWFKSAGVGGGALKDPPIGVIKRCAAYAIIILVLPLIWDPIALAGEQAGYFMQSPIVPMYMADGTLGPGTSVRYVLTTAGVNLHDQWDLISNMMTISLSIFTNFQAAIEGMMNQIILLLLSFVRLSMMATLSMGLFFMVYSKIVAVIIVLSTLPIWLVFMALPKWGGGDAEGFIGQMHSWGSQFSYTVLIGALLIGPIMGLMFFIGEQTLRAGLFGYMEIINWSVALMFMALAMAVPPAFVKVTGALAKAGDSAQAGMMQATVMASQVGTTMAVGAAAGAAEAKKDGLGAAGILGGAFKGGAAQGAGAGAAGALKDMGAGELGEVGKALGKGGASVASSMGGDDGKGGKGGGGAAADGADGGGGYGPTIPGGPGAGGPVQPKKGLVDQAEEAMGGPDGEGGGTAPRWYNEDPAHQQYEQDDKEGRARKERRVALEKQKYDKGMDAAMADPRTGITKQDVEDYTAGRKIDDAKMERMDKIQQDAFKHNRAELKEINKEKYYERLSLGQRFMAGGDSAGSVSAGIKAGAGEGDGGGGGSKLQNIASDIASGKGD